MSYPRKQKHQKTEITRTECPKETGISREKSAILNCRTFGVKPFISFLIRAFLFICTENLGSRKSVS